jgi:exopolyphosphatase/guanosine-5'-triphosphate,3'-diphosphate pyrophosphatase
MHKLSNLFTKRADPELMAAVDLGSNSFHLIAARMIDGQLHVLDSISEMVRLAAGLDARNYLTEESQQRALDCLARFSQRLRDIPTENIRVVGTNTLRVAKNAKDFVTKAEQVLQHPIDIIHGREEARLIYLGVAHTLANTSEKRLVIDIGGGSTEFIIGQKFESLRRESLAMGCVSASQRYFADGMIREKTMRKAEIAAMQELQPIEEMFQNTGWNQVVGASGTLKAINRIINEMGWDRQITATALQKLREITLQANHLNKLKLKGLSERRLPVFLGGLAILNGIFEGLNLKSMTVSEGALREGLCYDLLGRHRDEDVRERTIQFLTKRYAVDTAQAERVETTVLNCLEQVAKSWQLLDEEFAHVLSWAARLHEIGLMISHHHYHKHGEYILHHSDLSGFSQQEQWVLAVLVRSHRRKFSVELCQTCLHIEPNKLIRLGMLLRLAVLLHRERSRLLLPEFSILPLPEGLKLIFPRGWLAQHPLTQADLEQEREFLKVTKLQLEFE